MLRTNFSQRPLVLLVLRLVVPWTRIKQDVVRQWVSNKKKRKARGIEVGDSMVETSFRCRETGGNDVLILLMSFSPFALYSSSSPLASTSPSSSLTFSSYLIFFYTYSSYTISCSCSCSWSYSSSSSSSSCSCCFLAISLIIFFLHLSFNVSITRLTWRSARGAKHDQRVSHEYEWVLEKYKNVVGTLTITLTLTLTLIRQEVVVRVVVNFLDIDVIVVDIV